MGERADNILSYVSKQNRVWSTFAFTRRKMVAAGVVVPLLFVMFYLFMGPTSGQIRLDTGDLRYCWFGIPVYYDRMPEPERSKLGTLARRSPAVPAKWVTCVTYPLRGSFNANIACQSHYLLALQPGVTKIPKIARWAMDDLIK